jgi:hypothetical protein
MNDDHNQIHQQFFGASEQPYQAPISASRGSRFGHGCLISVTLLGFIPAVSLCARWEWTLMGVCLVTLYAIAVYSEQASWLAKIIYTIPLLLMLGLLGAGNLVDDLNDTWQDWQNRQQRDETRERMFVFYRDHYPQAMEARVELDAQIEDKQEKLATLGRIEAGDEQQRRLLSGSKARLGERLDRLSEARNDLDTGLMRMYLAYLEHGDPYGGTISREVEETVAQVSDVLTSIANLGGETGLVPLVPPVVPSGDE